MNQNNNKSTYCLVEAWSTALDLPSDWNYVALTQIAAAQLEQAGLPFITLEDFYTSGEIRGDTDQFLHAQLDWFDEFDDHLRKRFPLAGELKLNIASLYYYYIKYAVDNVIVTARILERFISMAQPKSVVFVHRPAGSTELEHILSFRNMESTYSLLIDIACATHNVDFHRITLPAADKDNANPDNGRSYQRVGAALKERAKNPLRKLRDFYFNYTRLHIPFSNGNKRNLRILLLHTSDFIFDFCIEARRYGFEFYALEGSQVVQYHPFGRRVMLSIDSGFKTEAVVDDAFVGGRGPDEVDRLYAWINNQSGFPIAGALRTRIEKFIHEICPDIISMVPGFMNFFRQHRIDYVLTHSIWSIVDHAAITAVRRSPGTSGVGFAHGTDAFEAKSRFFKIFRLFDYLFVTTEEEAEHERGLVESFGRQRPKVYSAKYFRNKYRHSPRWYAHMSPRLSTDKPIIVFVPIMCVPWPQRPIERTQPFPMEYLKWHKALVDFMATRTDYFFIWKGLYQPNQDFDYIADYIAAKNYGNISFQSGRLDRWLAVAQKVICDTPSTAFFEAIFSNVAVLSLYRPQDQRIRQNANATGMNLAPYTTIAEGLAQIDRFLDGAPEDYRVSIPASRCDVPAILMQARSTGDEPLTDKWMAGLSKKNEPV